MQVSRQISRRARAGLAVAVAATTLGLAPAVTAHAAESPVRTADSSASVECSSARAALAQAQKQQRVAKAKVAKARTAVKKAKKSHSAAKVRKAKKALAKAATRYRNVTRTVGDRQHRVGYACTAPTSPSRAAATGKALNILAVADGLAVGPINLGQLTALLDRLLPGVSGVLTGDQLNAMLVGFNAVAGDSPVNPADALALLGGAFSPAQVTQLLGGLADPALLTGLATHLLGQVAGLAQLPVPGSFDPTALLTTFAGVFGNLDPSQLGDLLGLLKSITGQSSSLNAGQLTDLLDSLVPGISDAFDPAQLTTMLTSLNGGGLNAASLANLMGGQFSAAQVSSVLAGTAAQDLVGKVVAQIVAQLSTAGAGGLVLPGAMSLSVLTDLVDSVTNLLGAVLGGGPLQGLCSLVPLPLLCS
ncbi:hypothetical protein [Marmoricola sp. RAF53]|uniref:hypothetical protein n=1 Tax=Marmoricola sp. RAF53 TaxID=3233059 RepID=UPI003F971CCA